MPRRSAPPQLLVQYRTRFTTAINTLRSEKAHTLPMEIDVALKELSKELSLFNSFLQYSIRRGIPKKSVANPQCYLLLQVVKNTTRNSTLSFTTKLMLHHQYQIVKALKGV